VDVRLIAQGYRELSRLAAASAQLFIFKGHLLEDQSSSRGFSNVKQCETYDLAARQPSLAVNE